MASDEADARGAMVEVIRAWERPAGVKQAPERGPHDATSDAVDVTCRVIEGDPARVLLHVAAQADLLVVGTRGPGGIAGLLLGR